MAPATGSEVVDAQRDCPAGCGRQAVQLAELAFGAFDDLPLTASGALVACQACGQVYRDGDFGQAELDALYRDHAFYAAAPTANGGMDPWDQDRYALSLAVLERHLNEEPHTIIDVGCGNGGFISYLARYGYENLYGVDLVMSRVEHVRHICELPAAIGSASKLPLPDLMPDLIVYSHLLEHVAEPRKALEQAAKRLPAGGLVYVEVADATRFAELPLSPLHWVGAAERVNLFDAHHLANLGRLAGLEPLETGQLTAPIAERVDIPVAYAVLRKGKGQALQPDEALKGGVAGYLKGQREALAGERDAVAELAAAGTPTIIWGVGHDLLCRFHESGLSRCKVVGLVDDASVRQDRKVGGIAVTGPKALSEATADHTIVLASPTRHAAMEARLAELGFAGKTLPLA